MTQPDTHDVEYLLCRHLDGQLDRRERRALEQRLEADPGLREQLRLYGALDGLLAGLSTEAIDGIDYDLQRAEIITAVERKVLLSTERRRRLVFRPRFLLTAAAAMLLMAVAVGVVVLWPGVGGAPTPIATMDISRVAPTPRPAGQISGTVHPEDLDDLPLDIAPSRAAAPAGTIVVSFGAPHEADGAPDEAVVVY
ncbi:MAG TPA: hypothetical protein VM031_00900 [Phycisphaerae bacterium]|nr:hypothetical protein [Phycisphaerae bacterium]